MNDKSATTPNISEAIARFATQMDGRSFPDSARHILKLSLLDWCAVAIAGRDEPVSRIVRDMVVAEGGVGEATVVGATARIPARAAALANGAISHALDYDDTHFDYIGHPSVAIFPAALALSEKLDLGGRQFLDAALVGVETACRVGAWLGPRHYRHGFHQTATSGAFGATACASRLLGLDVSGARNALGLVSTRASGLKSQFGTMGKPFNAGIAASNGVEAAILSAAGLVSRPDGLECEQGYGETHAGENSDVHTILSKLGLSFRFELVQHKLHACCHGLHAALEAIRAECAQTGSGSEDVDSLTIAVHPHWLRVCNIETPTTGLEAKFSYRLTAAMAISGLDTGDLSTFTDAVCNDPRITALRDRVIAIPDATLNDTSARINLVRRGGVSSIRLFDLDQPQPAKERERKVRAKAATLLGAERAACFWRQIGAMEQGSARQFAASLNQN